MSISKFEEDYKKAVDELNREQAGKQSILSPIDLSQLNIANQIQDLIRQALKVLNDPSLPVGSSLELTTFTALLVEIQMLLSTITSAVLAPIKILLESQLEYLLKQRKVTLPGLPNVPGIPKV